ncbi:RNA polymerase sigma factor [Butyrivibrio proteoclasticus]|uniref:RNA polymerase sigma factor n=1 Tax=Butyrivibrio proteoclasticus TaxID=43305 RepID=UPI000479A635|nr:sigma-70 family RNA polymerase sigma factor [Butyrivibrio proteoclasticus]
MGETGSKEKLIELMNRYKNLVFSVCLKLTGDYFAAEDIAQETFISAYQHLNDFDGASEKAWLCRIASNKCIDYLRSAERRAVPVSEEALLQNEESRDGPSRTFETRDVLEQVRDNCKALPDGYSEISQMYFIKGMTAKEIAQVTGIPLKTVQTKIYRAREMLKKTVRKEDLLA